MSEQSFYAWTFALQSLSHVGVNTTQLLEELGIRDEFLSDQDTPVPTSQFCELLDEAVRQTGDPDIGLKANLKADFADYGVVGYAILNARDLEESIKVLGAYGGMSQTHVQVSYQIKKSLCIWKMDITDWRYTKHRICIDWLMGLGLSCIRACVGRDWSPREVHFTYSEPTDTALHQQIIAAPVSFNCDSNSIVFEAKVLETTWPRADQRLFTILQHDLDRLLKQTLIVEGKQKELVAEVQAEIAQLLCGGPPSIDHVARSLNLSARTLQRRLADNGFAFKDLIEATRRQLAENYIKEGQYSLMDTAFMLGYSEVSSFNRAFRRWTDLTPTQYRKQHRGQIM